MNYEERYRSWKLRFFREVYQLSNRNISTITEQKVTAVDAWFFKGKTIRTVSPGSLKLLYYHFTYVMKVEIQINFDEKSYKTFDPILWLSKESWPLHWEWDQKGSEVKISETAKKYFIKIDHLDCPVMEEHKIRALKQVSNLCFKTTKKSLHNLTK